MDWHAALYNPIYSVFGVPAVLRMGAQNYALTVIDQTSGIEINAQGVELPTIAPAAVLRTSEAVAAGLTQDKMIDATLTIGGIEWTVKNIAERPGPEGKSTGEWLLFLVNGDL